MSRNFNVASPLFSSLGADVASPFGGNVVDEAYLSVGNNKVLVATFEEFGANVAKSDEDFGISDNAGRSFVKNNDFSSN